MVEASANCWSRKKGLKVRTSHFPSLHGHSKRKIDSFSNSLFHLWHSGFCQLGLYELSYLGRDCEVLTAMKVPVSKNNPLACTPKLLLGILAFVNAFIWHSESGKNVAQTSQLVDIVISWLP